MPKKKGQYQIPFDEDGNQLHYPEAWVFRDGRRMDVIWKENAPFKGTLKFDGYERGRSAAYLVFKDKKDLDVIFFMKDFEKLVPHMVKGEVKGTFQFTKRGQNYGCQLVEPA